MLRKVNSGDYVIRQNAVASALHDFGWNISGIIKAIKLLEDRHFYKSEPSNRNKWWVVDVYKARLFGERIYLHLYIDDTQGKLVINSFKEDTSSR